MNQPERISKSIFEVQLSVYIMNHQIPSVEKHITFLSHVPHQFLLIRRFICQVAFELTAFV